MEIEGDDVSGYYQARAMQEGSLLGSWSSIPVNGGYELMVDFARWWEGTCDGFIHAACGP